MHPCQQKAGLAVVLQNIVLLPRCHMPVFRCARTDTEDVPGLSYSWRGCITDTLCRFHLSVAHVNFII